MFKDLLNALTLVTEGDAEAAQIMLDDLIEQDKKSSPVNPVKLVDVSDNRFSPPSMVLATSFVWSATAQGYDYWLEMSEYLGEME